VTFLALFLVFFSYLLYFCPLVQSVGREFAGINIKRDKGMKLAEALSIRKDLQKRIQQLGQRIQNNVKVQEGDEPKEQPAELMKELDSCLSQLQELIWRINSTNIETKNGDGKTLTELMAQKDVLTMRISTLRSVFDTASSGQDRYSRSEIKMLTVVDVKALSKQIDEYSAQLRKLDIEIQALNFQTELK